MGKFMKSNCSDDVLRIIRNFPTWRFQDHPGPWIRVFYFDRMKPFEELELWKCVLRIVNTLKLLPNGRNITYRPFISGILRPSDIRELVQTGVIKDWFDKWFPGQPLPNYPSSQRLGIRDHDYRPLAGPILDIPPHHYIILQAMQSLDPEQREQHCEDEPEDDLWVTSSEIQSLQAMKTELTYLSRLYLELLSFPRSCHVLSSHSAAALSTGPVLVDTGYICVSVPWESCAKLSFATFCRTYTTTHINALVRWTMIVIQ